MDVGSLISGSSAFSKPSLCICKFSVHILLKPRLKDFEHNLTNMWSECNCTVVWTFLGIALLWDWSERGAQQSHAGALKCGPLHIATDRTCLSSGPPGIHALLRPTPVSPTLASSLVYVCSAFAFQPLLPVLGSSVDQPLIGPIRLKWAFSSQELCIFTHSCGTPDVLRLHESVTCWSFLPRKPSQKLPAAAASSQGVSGLRELCCVMRHCHLLVEALNLVPAGVSQQFTPGLVPCFRSTLLARIAEILLTPPPHIL